MAQLLLADSSSGPLVIWTCATLLAGGSWAEVGFEKSKPPIRIAIVSFESIRFISTSLNNWSRNHLTKERSARFAIARSARAGASCTRGLLTVGIPAGFQDDHAARTYRRSCRPRDFDLRAIIARSRFAVLPYRDFSHRPGGSRGRGRNDHEQRNDFREARSVHAGDTIHHYELGRGQRVGFGVGDLRHGCEQKSAGGIANYWRGCAEEAWREEGRRE